MRILSLYTKIAFSPLPSATVDAALSSEAWSLYTASGVWHALLMVATNNNDILTQINGLELIEEVVSTSSLLNDDFAKELTLTLLHGRGYVLSSSTTPTIIDSNINFNLVSTLRVFEKLAQVSAKFQLLSWFQTSVFTQALSFAYDQYDHEFLQAQAITCICKLSTFREGLMFMSNFVSTPAPLVVHDSVTPILLLQIPQFVYGSTHANGIRQIAALHGITEVLRQCYSDSTLSALQCAFFDQLRLHNVHRFSNGVECLMLIVKQPFEDMRDAGWNLLKSLVVHEWGIKCMLSAPGFFEYLLDRRTEFHMTGHQSKYEIIQSLSASPQAVSILPVTLMQQLREYTAQGITYAPRVVGVKDPISQHR